MILLVSDIQFDCLDIGIANRKSPITSLPRKIREFIRLSSQPVRCSFFQLTNYLPQGMISREHKQQVNMICYAINGDDETTDRLITTQSDFDSILVVRTKIQWFFEDNTPERWMDISSKLMQMRNFQTALGKEMNGKYYLQRSDSGSEFDKVYVYFVPHYHFEGGASGQHFIVRVNTTGTQVITPNFFADNFADNELEFDENLGSVCIYRYMLGLVPYRMSGDTKVERNTITLDELDFLETWIEDAGRCGGSYTISQ